MIGLYAEVRVVLVGFALVDGLRHQICVEPEDGPLSVNDLLNVTDRAAELFQADPESSMQISSSRHHGLQQAAIRRRARAIALVEAIQASGAFAGLTFFASASEVIKPYEVHTCIGVPTAALDSLPALDDDMVGFTPVARSLQHQVIVDSLARADRALHLPDPGSNLRVLGAAENIVKNAAERLIDGLTFRAAGLPGDLFRAVNAFTSLSYERAGAGGRLVIADRERIANWERVRFQKPVSLHDARIMRKLLELTDAKTAVLADYQRVFGLGTCDGVTDTMEIVVRGHADWEVKFEGLPLMRVAYGVPKLPIPWVEREEFADIAERLVGPIGLDPIWEFVKNAQAGGRGTTLVVSHDPEGEASRLGGQAMPIAPDFLDPGDIVRLGSVDGAVILGPDGRCHAFGVILDGDASAAQGDPARGARYNSAVRYQRSRVAKSLLVVISDDGTVDLIPHLKPRKHRQEVEGAVNDFLASCHADPVDGEEFARTHQRVTELAFYLNEDQCRRINGAYEKEMRRRIKEGGIAAYSIPLRPHQDMDDSYFY